MIMYIFISYVVMIVNAIFRRNQIDEMGIAPSNIIWDIALAPITFPLLIFGWVVSIFSTIFSFLSFDDKPIEDPYPMYQSLGSNALSIIELEKKKNYSSLEYELERRQYIFDSYIDDDRLEVIIEKTKSHRTDVDKMIYEECLKQKEIRKNNK